MNKANAREYLNLIDTSTPGRRYDVTPVFAEFAAFSALLDDLLELSRDVDYNTIVAIDALGFILGAALAVRSEKRFVPVRKEGKLPVDVQKAKFVDYTGDEKSLEIRIDALSSSDRVLLVDEWVETAAQVKAAIGLIEGQDAEVAGVLTINVDNSEAVSELRESYPIMALSEDL